jgi:hypothetical protein|tara:strand:+ start:6563 stop:7060 length:498 start_codon:yes stop_codon:yes gene_type:complete
MDDNQRLKLQEMITVNNVEDNTSLIRNLKHSRLFKADIAEMLERKKEKMNDDDMHIACMGSCNFLYTNYTDIYNKIRKDEIDINILHQFIEVLMEIEDGNLNQHEGSFKIGSILKEMYVDSALRKAEKLNKIDDQPHTERNEGIEVSWKQYKKMNPTTNKMFSVR